MTRKKAIFEVNIGLDLNDVVQGKKAPKPQKTVNNKHSIEKALVIVSRQMEVSGLRERTISDYQLHVSHFSQITKVMYLEDITLDSIYDWLNLMGVSNSTKLIKPQKEDIIYCREGSGAIGKAVGKAGILLDENVCLAQRVVLLRANYQKVLPKYFAYALNSPIMLKQVSLNISQTTSPRINISTLKKLKIPVGPIDIQQNIVNMIEKFLISEQEASNLLRRLDDELDSIKQSVLSKAYRGELGTNDPSEENAIQLLKEVLHEQSK